MLLLHKICLLHFSPGKEPHEIAVTMGIEQPLVIALLRKAMAIMWSKEKFGIIREDVNFMIRGHKAL
jgi:hypothetical protein